MRLFDKLQKVFKKEKPIQEKSNELHDKLARLKDCSIATVNQASPSFPADTSKHEQSHQEVDTLINSIIPDLYMACNSKQLKSANAEISQLLETTKVDEKDSKLEILIKLTLKNYLYNLSEVLTQRMDQRMLEMDNTMINKPNRVIPRNFV